MSNVNGNGGLSFGQLEFVKWNVMKFPTESKAREFMEQNSNKFEYCPTRADSFMTGVHAVYYRDKNSLKKHTL